MPLLRPSIRHVVSQCPRRFASANASSTSSNVFINTPESTIETDATSQGSKAHGPLKSRTIAVKDNISTRDLPTTCASRTLEGFRSPYDATVIELLKKHGAVINGKTNMDEFGMGSHSTHSYYGAVSQVYRDADGSQIEYAAGGSSGGSALAVQQDMAWGALGTDTGGSVRLPAAWCGVVGFKPSYGMVSRWGVIDYANSLDTVGFLARDVQRCKKMFEALSHYDAQDPTSLPPITRTRIRDAQSGQRVKRIGIPIEYNIAELSPLMRSAWLNAMSQCQQAGFEVVPVSLPSTKSALSAYYVLAPAEASSNLAKYDGVRYGRRAEGPDGAGGVLFSKTRAENFGAEVKRRILLGSYSLSAAAIDNYFIQAQKVRRKVQYDFNAVFAQENALLEASLMDKNSPKVDLLLCPTAPTPPPKLQDIAEQAPVERYINDVFTVPASLAGLPAISIPWGPRSSDPARNVGIQLIGQFCADEMVLDFAESLETMSKNFNTEVEAPSSATAANPGPEEKQAAMFPRGLATAYMNIRDYYGPNVAAVRSPRHDLRKGDLAGEKQDGQTWKERGSVF